MLKYLRQLLEQPELPETVERSVPTLPTPEGRYANARIHKAIKRRRFHERHATRQRRLAAELIREARARGVPVWE